MRYAVRIPGRGVVTELNGNPITERATAEQIVRSLDLMYGLRGKVETLVLDLPLPGSNSHELFPPNRKPSSQSNPEKVQP